MEAARSGYLVLRAAALALLLFVLGWFAAAWGPASSPGAKIEQPRITHVWRRTAQGWQKAVWRDRIRIVPYQPSLHPSVVGAFQILAALTIGAYVWTTRPAKSSPSSRR
ncbi:MAG: hypothetical protein KF708_12540 [Pirellulales bacterium]|nr:hypothetical protein [Pirellulales bacterium]